MVEFARNHRYLKNKCVWWYTANTRRIACHNDHWTDKKWGADCFVSIFTREC